MKSNNFSLLKEDAENYSGIIYLKSPSRETLQLFDTFTL